MKGIYQYKDLETDDVVYIGKDSYIKYNNRHIDHLSPSKYDEQQINRILQNNPNRYEYSVLYSSDDVSDNDLKMLEISFIERYNPKFNFTKGGEGITGFKHSDKSKQKMSDAKKGKNNPFYGKHHTEETMIKQSKSRNTSGYFRVSKWKTKSCTQGFFWSYRYHDENGKRKVIVSVDIKKLEKKVKAKGLKWRKFE